MTYSKILLYGLKISNQFKVLHWQTNDSNKHDIYRQIYEYIDYLNDELLLICMAQLNKKIGVGLGNIGIIKNIDKIDVILFIDLIIKFYTLVKLFIKKDNIPLDTFDNVITKITKYKYLLRMDDLN